MITAERFSEVSRVAFSLWSGFRQTYSDLDISARGRFASKVSPLALSFFRYAVQIFHGVAGSTVVSTSQLAGSGAASWLWFDGTRPLILMDFGVIGAAIPAHSERRVAELLILKETGHTCLHWRSMTSNASRGLLPMASTVQLEEAWVFAGSVVGLIHAEAATSGRPGIADAGWLIA